MAVLGIVFLVILALIAAVLLFWFLVSLPDYARYRRVRKM